MAAAGLWTTPSDLARYVIEIQLAYEGKSQKVLSQNMVKQMLTKQADGPDGPIGLGPFVHETGSSRYFEHDGGDDGFVCKFVGYLDRGQGAIVMTNSDTGGRLVRDLLNAIAEVYEWPSRPILENERQ
jgi:CubicO group peptidase (beta-lactamase class C family)